MTADLAKEVVKAFFEWVFVLAMGEVFSVGVFVDWGEVVPWI